jgi:hypothetical protein
MKHIINTIKSERFGHALGRFLLIVFVGSIFLWASNTDYINLTH